MPDVFSKTFVPRFFVGDIEVDPAYVEYAFRSRKNGGMKPKSLVSA